MTDIPLSSPSGRFSRSHFGGHSREFSLMIFLPLSLPVPWITHGGAFRWPKISGLCSSFRGSDSQRGPTDWLKVGFSRLARLQSCLRPVVSQTLSGIRILHDCRTTMAVNSDTNVNRLPSTLNSTHGESAWMAWTNTELTSACTSIRSHAMPLCWALSDQQLVTESRHHARHHTGNDLQFSCSRKPR